MPYAVEMFFDKESDGYIRGLWRTLKESGISSYMHDSDNVPHITYRYSRNWILPMRIRDWLLLRKRCLNSSLFL